MRCCPWQGRLRPISDIGVAVDLNPRGSVLGMQRRIRVALVLLSGLVLSLAAGLGFAPAASAVERIVFSASELDEPGNHHRNPRIYSAQSDGAEVTQIGRGTDPQITAAGDSVVFAKAGGANGSGDQV